MSKVKKYYIAWDKQNNRPINVFDMTDSSARWKCWAWLDYRHWNKDKIIKDNDGKEYTWIEACANTGKTLLDFTLDTWLGYTNFTDPDMRLYEVIVKEDE